jgi:hypothetical protein
MYYLELKYIFVDYLILHSFLNIPSSGFKNVAKNDFLETALADDSWSESFHLFRSERIAKNR